MMSATKRNILSLVGGIALLGIAAPATFAQDGGGAGHPKPEAKQPEKEHKDHKEHKDTKQEGKHAGAKIGAPAPSFEVTDTDGKTHRLSDYKGKVVVLEWFNPGCPVVQMHYNASTMTDLQSKYKDKNVVWLAVNSGGAGKQGNGKETNAKARKDWHMAYPVLLDESGTVGRAYGAKTTPHMFIINEQGTLVYAGGIDNGSPSKPGDTNYVDQALTQVLAKETVVQAETKSYGCGIKYGKESN
jgi:peroxiredoxin